MNVMSEKQRGKAREILDMTDAQVAVLPKAEREICEKFRVDPEFEEHRKQAYIRPQRKGLKPGTKLKVKIISCK